MVSVLTKVYNTNLWKEISKEIYDKQARNKISAPTDCSFSFMQSLFFRTRHLWRSRHIRTTLVFNTGSRKEAQPRNVRDDFAAGSPSTWSPGPFQLRGPGPSVLSQVSSSWGRRRRRGYAASWGLPRPWGMAPSWVAWELHFEYMRSFHVIGTVLFTPCHICSCTSGSWLPIFAVIVVMGYSPRLKWHSSSCICRTSVVDFAKCLKQKSPKLTALFFPEFDFGHSGWGASMLPQSHASCFNARPNKLHVLRTAGLMRLVEDLRVWCIRGLQGA